jgi:Ca2+/Na+ antiporter
MGITFLAIGTSIPDAIASLIACRRGKSGLGFPWRTSRF